jgi:hypothetical protein
MSARPPTEEERSREAAYLAQARETWGEDASKAGLTIVWADDHSIAVNLLLYGRWYYLHKLMLRSIRDVAWSFDHAARVLKRELEEPSQPPDEI